jgi:hypothetical protein
VSGGCSNDGSMGALCSSVRRGGPHRGAEGTDTVRGGRQNTAVLRPLRRAGDGSSPPEMADLGAQVEEVQWDYSRPFQGSASST